MDSNNLNLFDSASRKNIYEVYSESNWVGQSKTEILFEKWLEKTERVKMQILMTVQEQNMKQ